MTQYPQEPLEQPIRARVPEHVSGGAFSTGVIVMTAQTEFILDFVQNLGRPHQIVARVVMPHSVLPQLVDALQRNMDLYRSRWGELPQAIATGSGAVGPAPVGGQTPPVQAGMPDPTTLPDSAASYPAGTVAGGGNPIGPPSPGITDDDDAPQPPQGADAAGAADAGVSGGPPDSGSIEKTAQPGSGARQASAQEIYDDLKIRDELLSGSYANAVMIGHGPHEFSFDFITNFYPHSAVSSRVFLAAGQVPRLYDSLRGTWAQLRQRMKPPRTGGPQPPPFPQTPPSSPDDDVPPTPDGDPFS